MESAVLTPSSLSTALEAVRSAKTETECASSLVAAATLIQDAVLCQQEPDSVVEALSSCPEELREQMTAALDRSVNFHLLPNGGTLGLWLLPLVVSVNPEIGLPPVLALETSSLHALRMSSLLGAQLGVQKEVEGRMGWVTVLPKLISAEIAHSLDLGVLINLPHQAREAVRGSINKIELSLDEAVPHSVPDTLLYYLPMVAFHPDEKPVLPPHSSNVITRMSQWFQASVGLPPGSFELHALSQPHPFSVALPVGESIRQDIMLRKMLSTICQQTAMAPNAMAGLVAPYAVRQADGNLVMGITLVSRLTQAVVATLSLPVNSDDVSEDVARVTHVLRDMGMDCLQVQQEPIPTIACQHCGTMQYMAPNPQTLKSNWPSAPHHIH